MYKYKALEFVLYCCITVCFVYNKRKRDSREFYEGMCADDATSRTYLTGAVLHSSRQRAWITFGQKSRAWGAIEVCAAMEDLKHGERIHATKWREESNF